MDRYLDREWYPYIFFFLTSAVLFYVSFYPPLDQGLKQDFFPFLLILN